jgi:hypothetical protein
MPFLSTHKSEKRLLLEKAALGPVPKALVFKRSILSMNRFIIPPNRPLEKPEFG